MGKDWSICLESCEHVPICERYSVNIFLNVKPAFQPQLLNVATAEKVTRQKSYSVDLFSICSQSKCTHLSDKNKLSPFFTPVSSAQPNTAKRK